MRAARSICSELHKSFDKQMHPSCVGVELKRIVAGILSALLILMPLFLQQDMTAKGSPIDHHLFSSLSESGLTSHDPIAISGDNDFIQQGWPGAGTPNNPFLIENLRVVSDITCISIQNVESHFIIRNCYLWHRPEYQSYHRSEGEAISIVGSANGTITDSVIESDTSGLYISESGMIHVTDSIISGYQAAIGQPSRGADLRGSSNCIIEDSFFTLWRTGLNLIGSNYTSIANCTIVENGYGIELIGGYWNKIMDSTVVRNEVIGITLMDNSNNSIYGNRIESAYDWDGPNTWDDNVSLGNGWRDYSGTGTYSIPGDSNSFDRYPWLCADLSYAIKDRIGPRIDHEIWLTITMTSILYHPMHQFYATVTDDSEVDTVLVFYRFSEEPEYRIGEMNKTSDQSATYVFQTRTPDPYDGSVNYYYRANDSLGNIRDTDVDYIYWHGPPPYGTLVILVGLATSAVVLFLVIGYFMSRKSAQSS